MKAPQHRTERGQALILIVFAIIGLIGMTALAIDGGNVYAERRRAQNAADTSAIAAALSKARGGDVATYDAAALTRAASNNYNDSDAGASSSSPDVNVEVYSPPISVPGSGNAYVGNSQYVQVIITATIKTYFGRVIGISQITNKVQAIARAKPPITRPMANGNAIVGLEPNDCKAIFYQGNADAIITGGGLYSNSACADAAFFNNSSSAQLTAPCLQAVGGIQYANGALNIPSSCILRDQPPLPSIVYPDPKCDVNAQVNGSTMSPGNYSGNKFPPAGVTNLDSGIYCINQGDFTLNGNDTLTGEHVVIVVRTGNVTWNGGANIKLSAPTTGPYAGLLLFLPESNHATVKIDGNSSSTFTGSILAPSSEIDVNGTGSPEGLDCQVIGNTVNISGTTTMKINYNAGNQYWAPIPPQIELVQ